MQGMAGNGGVCVDASPTVSGGCICFCVMLTVMGSNPKCRSLHIPRVSCLWAVSVYDTEPERHRSPRDIVRQPALISDWI